tara:strand:+ start:1149 stop:2315 length:1167 start_codon:yes stop_codon:yes gene_type:complete
MPTHKITNEFIRKYNKEFAIKGYSKMTVAEKTTAIQNAVNKTGGAMKAEWAGIMKNYKPRGGGGTTARKTTARKKPTKAKADDMAGFLAGLASPAKKPSAKKKPPDGRIMKDGPYKGMKLFDRHGGRKDGGRRATEPLPVADRRTKIDLRTKKKARVGPEGLGGAGPRTAAGLVSSSKPASTDAEYKQRMTRQYEQQFKSLPMALMKQMLATARDRREKHDLVAIPMLQKLIAKRTETLKKAADRRKSNAPTTTDRAPGDPTGIRVKTAKAIEKFQRDLDAADVRLYDMTGGEYALLTDSVKREIEKHDDNGMGFFTNAHTKRFSGGKQYYAKIQLGKRPVSKTAKANQQDAIAVLKKQPAFLRNMFSFVFYYGTDDDLMIIHYDDNA